MSKNLIPAQRRKLIQDFLSIHTIASLTELSNLVETSEATVRRDLEQLENENILERTSGGAILQTRMNLESAYDTRAISFPDEKQQIGALAANMIADGDVVFINSGSTTTQIIKHLPKDAHITVITNNMTAVTDFENDVSFEIILLGGNLNKKVSAVTGQFALNNLSQIYADKLFFGVDGISPKYGCTVPTNSEAEIIRMMIERTRGLKAVVTDHSKWGVVSNYEVASLGQINALITDNGIDEEAYGQLFSHSVDIIISHSKQFSTP
ncbi:MAG: DeoR/GlpR family DNA-binding transcription regulator [Chloroflexota bacterium]